MRGGGGGVVVVVGADTPTREQQSGVAREQDGSSSRASDPTDAASLVTPAREALDRRRFSRRYTEREDFSYLMEIEGPWRRRRTQQAPPDAGAEGGADTGTSDRPRAGFARDAALHVRSSPTDRVDAGRPAEPTLAPCSRARRAPAGIATTSSTTRGREERHDVVDDDVRAATRALVGVDQRAGACRRRRGARR